MTLELDPQGFPMWRGELLELPRKERAVLALLIRARGQVVSKQAFADEAWNGALMSDESLARCVSQLRRALPGVEIESVYGTGYRLSGSPQVAHTRLLAASRAAPHAVETHLHARTLALRRTPTAMQRALALLRALVAAHPDYASARVTLAESLAGAASWGLLAGAGFVEEGLAELDAAQRTDARTPGIATCRAWLLDLAWRFEEAEDAYRDALAASPDADTLFLHGWHRLALGQPDAAASRFREAIAQQPHAPLFPTMLARAHYHAGRLDEALDEMNATCRDHPDSAVAALFRAGLLAQANPQPALADLAWRLAEQPDAPPYALGVLTYVLARCGRGAEAAVLIEACLACSSSTPCSAALHAAACIALGDDNRAARLIAEAVEARCGLVPMLLREPANAAVRDHPLVAPLFARVFG
ncbi:hypothetical protein GCM10027034_36920 [Ramlibacter solisilvae]